jgi:hypothetical protein
MLWIFLSSLVLFTSCSSMPETKLNNYSYEQEQSRINYDRALR